MTSNVRGPGTSGNETLHNEAASWFVRLHTREPRTEEVVDWQHWLNADEAHRHAFSRFEDLWQAIGQTELHFRVQGVPGTLAPQTDIDTGAREEVDAVAPAAVSAARWPLALAATVLLAAIGAGFFWWRSMQLPQLAASSVVETRTAEDRRYALEDGSRVDVGARSRVVVDFSESTRSIIIDDGEAYFEVAREARPFVVRAGAGTITAVGTAFNVRNVQGRVTVAVVEGKVKVRELGDHAQATPVAGVAPTPSAAIPTVVVRAGEGMVYGRAAKSVEAFDTRVATAWREGHLKFLREPLGYVVADVERYTDIQLSLADPAAAELLYTGTVIPEEIDNWIVQLGDIFPIEAQRIGERTVLLKLRAPGAAASEQ
jgi:transmembrane sensor